MIAFDNDEPPLIRLGRTLRRELVTSRRWLWAVRKLALAESQKAASLALVIALVPALTPTSSAQAAEIGPLPVQPAPERASLFAGSIIEETTAELTDGFTEKPIIVTTDIGIPERELREKERQQQEAEQRRRAAVRFAAQQQASRQRTQATPSASTVVATKPAGITTGNSYPYGYCTWWAKERRPDLPNQLGNARNWFTSAARAGYATGHQPRAGAVVVTRESGWGHVAYVQAVEGGDLILSEMNVVGWGKVSQRRLPANSGVIIGYVY